MWFFIYVLISSIAIIKLVLKLGALQETLNKERLSNIHIKEYFINTFQKRHKKRIKHIK